MNYIRLINAFYDRLETNPLNASAIALWHALVHVNNRAGWLDEFSVAVSVLCVKAGISERTISNARNDLKQKGYIDFKSRRGNRSATYKLYDLSANFAGNHCPERPLSAINAGNLSDNRSDNRSDNLSDNRSALLKLNKTKLNETNTSAADVIPHVKFFDTYFVCFGRQPNALQIDEINNFIDKDGLPDEVICEAFKKAAENGAKYNYARAILVDWAKKGIKSLDDVVKEQEKHQKKRHLKSNGITRKENLPEWFIEQKEQEEQAKDNQEQDDFDYEAEKRRLEEKFNKEVGT